MIVTAVPSLPHGTAPSLAHQLDNSDSTSHPVLLFSLVYCREILVCEALCYYQEVVVVARCCGDSSFEVLESAFYLQFVTLSVAR